MIVWIGLVVSLSFFLLWGGGVLHALGRRRLPTDRESTQGESALHPAPVPEEQRLQVFEEFMRSLPDEEENNPGSPGT